MGINSTEVSYGFGQLGSMFLDGTAAASPPTGMVFVAITCLTDVTFDTTGGLLADTTNTARGLEYMGTDVAAHNVADGSETVISGSVGDCQFATGYFTAISGATIDGGTFSD